MAVKLMRLSSHCHSPLLQVLARQPMETSPEDSLFQLLNQFQMGKSHLAIVSNDVDLARKSLKKNFTEASVPNHVRVLGVISIEDIVGPFQSALSFMSMTVVDR